MIASTLPVSGVICCHSHTMTSFMPFGFTLSLLTRWKNVIKLHLKGLKDQCHSANHNQNIKGVPCCAKSDPCIDKHDCTRGKNLKTTTEVIIKIKSDFGPNIWRQSSGHWTKLLWPPTLFTNVATYKWQDRCLLINFFFTNCIPIPQKADVFFVFNSTKYL